MKFLNFRITLKLYWRRVRTRGYYSRVDHFENVCLPKIQNNTDEYYLKVWKRIYTSEAIKRECNNILHIFEILLSMPFTNAKLERMGRVKTDFRNRLKRKHLDARLRISEEGSSVEYFNPDEAIDAWFVEKDCRLTTKPSTSYKKRVIF